MGSAEPQLVSGSHPHRVIGELRMLHTDRGKPDLSAIVAQRDVSGMELAGYGAGDHSLFGGVIVVQRRLELNHHRPAGGQAVGSSAKEARHIFLLREHVNMRTLC